MGHQKPKINLKQHQRFKRQVPWQLIRKIAIVAVMVALIYYLLNIPERPKEPLKNADEFEVEIETI